MKESAIPVFQHYQPFLEVLEKFAAPPSAPPVLTTKTIKLTFDFNAVNIPATNNLPANCGNGGYSSMTA
jgi:hypothetical protein